MFRCACTTLCIHRVRLYNNYSRVVVEALSAKVEFSCQTETTSTVVVCTIEATGVLPFEYGASWEWWKGKS